LSPKRPHVIMNLPWHSLKIGGTNPLPPLFTARHFNFHPSVAYEISYRLRSESSRFW
jgi:hypothetical protein